MEQGRSLPRALARGGGYPWAFVLEPVGTPEVMAASDAGHVMVLTDEGHLPNGGPLNQQQLQNPPSPVVTAYSGIVVGEFYFFL